MTAGNLSTTLAEETARKHRTEQMKLIGVYVFMSFLAFIFLFPVIFIGPLPIINVPFTFDSPTRSTPELD